MKIINWFKDLFRHNCASHEEVTSVGYVKYDGAWFKGTTECKCTKCGNKRTF